MKKTAPRKIDKVIGIIILIIIGLFIGRHFLSGIPEYKKAEEAVSEKLNLPAFREKVIKALKLPGRKEAEGFQRKRKARLKRERRPRFDIKIPRGKEENIKYEATPLFDKSYYLALKAAIKRARKYIYVAMFVVSVGESPRNPVNVLLNELIAAGKRGVDVKVIVECPRRSVGSLYKKNERAIRYLKNGGVEACFNYPKKELHDKFVLIDGDTLFVGNHNWTKQSLTINREVSVEVKSSLAGREFIQHFMFMKLARREETKEGKIELIKKIYKELLGREKQG